MTCYDLRFPELARALVVAGAEALVVPAAWVAGERKVEHWRTLLRARAIENTVWVVGVGQPGPRYTGHSMVVAPDGDVVLEAGEDADRARRRPRPGRGGRGTSYQPVAGQPADVSVVTSCAGGVPSDRARGDYTRLSGGVLAEVTVPGEGSLDSAALEGCRSGLSEPP